jgi:hypothetical protein
VRDAGGDQFRVGRPVVDYFDNWREAAEVLGCTQAGADPAPTATPSPAPRRVPPLHAIAGTYETDRGDMQIDETGGTYGRYNGRITITRIDGDNVEGTWAQDGSIQRCPDGTYDGRFRFRFDTSGFTGTYGECDEPPTARPWVGARDAAIAPPQPQPPPVVAAADSPVPAPPAAPPPAPIPASDPRYPVNAPGFRPLPQVKPAEAGWNPALYRELSERVARIGGLREQGRCDDYRYSMSGLRADFAEELAYAGTLGAADLRARRPVIEYFRAWWSQADGLGCDPPLPTPVAVAAAPPPPAPPPVAAAPPPPAPPEVQPLLPIQPAVSFWNHGLYAKYKEWAEGIAADREAGRCLGRYQFWDAHRSMGIALDRDLQEATREGGGTLQAALPVIEYFEQWRARANSLSCQQRGPYRR